MKNLKRALSLVLSTAMLAGMMMVGTGAAFADVKAEHNEEAIAVVSAAGIMGANKEFNPDDLVTRNEMAVIMVNMLDLDTGDYAGASKFTDVPAWAADYVDACYANGIVSGTSATTYSGAANVTTTEAALMMMKALGYFEYKDFGEDWALTTIKKASQAGLLDGIDAKATAKLTRNEVAQMALNALEATCVEAEKSGSNTSITAGDVEIKVDSVVTYTKVGENMTNGYTKYDYNGAKDGYQQLIEKLFGNDYTKTEGGKTALGLPAVVWKNEDGDEIIAVADTADDVVVSDDTYANNELVEAYTDLVDEDYDAKDDYKLKWAVEDASVSNGDELYFYEDDDTDTITAYVVKYVMAEITEINDEMTKTEVKNGHSLEITLKLRDADGTVVTVYDDNFAGFDYEEDDYVLVAFDVEDDEVIAASELAECVKGEITSIASSNKVKIDGTTYKNVSGKTVAEENEITAYLNKAGQIALITKVDSTSSEDYAYIYNTYAAKEETDEDGNVNAVYYVYVVLADGSKAKYTVDTEVYKTEEALKALKGSVVPYEIESGELKVVEMIEEHSKKVVEELTMGEDDKYIKVGTTKIYADSKTEFIFAANDKDDKMVVTTATGVKNVDIKKAPATVIYNDDNEIVYVFVMAEDEGVSSDDTIYAIMRNTNWTRAKNEDGDYVYTYNVIVGSTETTVDFIGDDLKDYMKGDMIAYTMDGDYAELDTNKMVSDVIGYVGEDYLEFKKTEGEFTYEDAEIYRVTFEYDNETDYTNGKIDSVSVKGISSFSKDTDVKFVANDDGEIEIIYVYKYNY